MRRALAALLCLGLGLLAGAEPPGRFLFRTYGPEQGFLESGLNTMVQDAEGSIWIGSDNGLVRYDGVSFHLWTAQDGLASSNVSRILRRKAGGIWVMSEGGLVRLDQGVVKPILFEGKPFKAIRGSAMDVDGDGTLWALGFDGLYRQSGDTMARVVKVTQGRGKALACRSATGSVFAVVGDQVWELRKDGGWSRFTAEDGLPSDGIESLAVDGEGRLWVVGMRLLRYQDPGDKAFRDASSWLPAPPFASGTINRETDGWIGLPTNAGLLRLKGDDHEVINEAVGLPCKWTVASCRDREGSLWVLGPTLYRQLGRGWTRAFTSRDGLPSDLVWLVFRDRSGRLYAGTSEGLAVLGASGWTKIRGTDGLNVTSLCQDAQGRLLLGCNNAPMRAMEPGASEATGAFLKSFKGAEGGRPDRSQAVVARRDGTLWLSDPARGIFRLDPATRSMRLEYGPVQSGFPEFAAWQLVEDASGRLWSATNCGLIVLDAAGWHRFGQAQGLQGDALNGLALDRDGSAWVFYREPRGISRISYEGGAFKVLEHRDTSQGLVSNVVYAGAVDAQGTLWLGTDRGVEAWQGRSSFRLDHGGGLAGDDCSQNAILAEPGQDVWVGTSTGLAHVVAGCKPPALGPLQVIITQVDRGRQRYGPPYAALGPVAHRDATLEFRFAARTYVNEQAVQYQIRLAGLEDEWRTPDVPQARYAALPSGDYRFEARARYPGTPFGPVTAYAFEVLPPWWRTWWFLSLEILGGAGLVALLTSLRFRTLAHQKERLAAMVDQATGDLVRANHALEKANLALQAQSLTDPLTNLHNRRFLSVVVDDDLAKVQRSYRDWHPGQPLPNNDLVFLMVDLDRFKAINDTYGHPVGDKVLQVVAQALRKAARETDGVIRWGGEEFLVLARNSTRAEAQFMAERIRTFVAEQELVLDSGEVLRWTCSVGYAAYPFSLQDLTWLGWERVVEIADACLYMAKRAGRNAWAGAEALAGLDRAAHNPRLPWELPALIEEGVVGIRASKPETKKKKAKASS